MIITFSFSINQDNKEAVFAGNITPQAALQFLQAIVISEAIKQSKGDDTEKEKDNVD